MSQFLSFQQTNRLKQLIIQKKKYYGIMAIYILTGIFTIAGTAYGAPYFYAGLAYLILHGLLYKTILGLTTACTLLTICLCTLAFSRITQILSEKQAKRIEDILTILCFLFFTSWFCLIIGILKLY